MADLPPPRPVSIDVGAQRSSAAVIVDRRVTPQQQRRGQRLRAALAGRVVRERRLDKLLDRELGPVAVVLHDRRARGAEPVIDHLVVAASGVWLIEARHEAGRVVRGHGASHHGEAWLRVGTGGRVPLSDRLGAPADLVQGHLDVMGFGWLEVHRALCLTNARWGVVPRPFRLGETWVIWGRSLAARIAVPGPVGPAEMNAVAVELGARFPAGS